MKIVFLFVFAALPGTLYGLPNELVKCQKDNKLDDLTATKVLEYKFTAGEVTGDIKKFAECALKTLHILTEAGVLDEEYMLKNRPDYKEVFQYVKTLPVKQDKLEYAFDIFMGLKKTEEMHAKSKEGKP